MAVQPVLEQVGRAPQHHPAVCLFAPSMTNNREILVRLNVSPVDPVRRPLEQVPPGALRGQVFRLGVLLPVVRPPRRPAGETLQADVAEEVAGGAGGTRPSVRGYEVRPSLTPTAKLLRTQIAFEILFRLFTFRREGGKLKFNFCVFPLIEINVLKRSEPISLYLEQIIL